MMGESMNHHAAHYYHDLRQCLGGIRVTDAAGKSIDFAAGVEAVTELIRALSGGRKIMFIGNGGSAAISSHMAVDFWKNGGIRALAFNDVSLLTCVGNDCGYGYVFEKSIRMFADAGDILVAISCSGRSENILLGVTGARTRGCKVITLSGFDADNPLSLMGDYNFYVPSHAYGLVEVIHHSICSCILDAILKERKG
jgi:D-sedoheptulose 7-phosphate isomerase